MSTPQFHRLHSPWRQGLRDTFDLLAACWRRWHQRLAQHRREHATRAMLHQIDERTLRDLGFVRSEIASVARESCSATVQPADATRRVR